MDLSLVITAAVVVAVIVIIFSAGYIKAPTNEAYVISGLKKEPRVLIGRAGIKIPFLERKDTLLIKQISVDIKTNGYINTTDFIGVDIDATAKVHLITEKDVTVDENGNWLPHIAVEENTPRITREMAWAAMKNFLNMDEEDIIDELTESLQGNMREIISTQSLKQLCTDRKGFGDEVQAKAQKDMNVLGVYIASCNIQKITDKESLIIALGEDNMAKIKKDASIAKAQAEAEVSIAESKAKQDANDARIATETEIAKKNNELAITQSNLKIDSDKKKAEADAAYKIQEQEQRRSIEIAEANADIARQEREIELREKEVAVKERALEAEVKKQAEADRYAAQQKADAELYQRQKDAEAKQFEAERDAEAKKAQADAKRYAAQQEAESIKAVGEAEAAAIQAKGIAEAEAMDKKAEAMAKYGKAAMAEMFINVLPDVAGKIAEPLTQIDKITIIGGGDGSNGVEQIAGNVPTVMAKVFESMKETTGIDLSEIMKAETYDAKVNKHVTLDGLDTVRVVVAEDERTSNKKNNQPDADLSETDEPTE